VSLSRLELVGFKSFMNLATLELKKGITCILGPNGCGKTNIVDAVRWVLGEQSARQLRSTKMENVIFNGTEAHKPTGFAIVNMTVSNEKGAFPIDYSEITITRKVYRSGISEYFINKSPCRLKDIRELFADTGTGSHSYSVIEQEMVEYVLNDAHGERRNMFEEAAGIVKYRMRREEAKRKLKLTANDLLRLNDILEELGKNVRSLKYQVGKTKRYRTISERIRSFGLVHLRRSLSDLLGKKREAEKELAGGRELTERDDVSLEERERKVEEEKLLLVDLEKKNTDLQNKRYEVRRKIQRAEEKIIQFSERKGESERLIERAGREIEEAGTRLERIAERIEGVRTEVAVTGESISQEQEEVTKLAGLFEEVSVKIERIQGELIDLKQTQLDFIQDQARVESTVEHYERILAELNERSGKMRERIVSLEVETVKLSGERDAREGSLSEAQRVLTSLENENAERTARLETVESGIGTNASVVAGNRASLAAMKSRHELYAKMKEDFEGFPGGARHVLKKGDSRVKGPLAEMIETKKKYSRALEAVLGGLMDGVVIDSMPGAVDFARELSEGKLGGARFLADDPGWDASGDPVPEAAGILGAIASFVDTPAEARRAVDQILDGIYLFDTIENALAFITSVRGGVVGAVSLSGIFYSRGRGIYFSGSPDEEVSIFGRTGEIERLSGEICSLEKEIAGLEQEAETLRSEKESVRERIEEIARLSTRAREELGQRREAFQEVEREYIMGKEKASMMMKSLDELENSRVETLSKLEEARLALAMRQDSGDISDSERLESELSVLRKNREELDAGLTSRKVRLASLQGTIDRQNEELRGLGEMEKQFRAIIEQRSVEISSAKEETARLERSIEEERVGVKIFLDEESSYEEEIGGMHDVLEEKRELIGGIEGELKKNKAEREAIFEKINDLRVNLSSIDTHMKDLVDRGMELYEEDLGCYIEGGEIPLTEEESLITKDMLDNEKRKLESLGPVNLAAVEEYDEKKHRFEFLTSQKEDLVKASEELDEAIKKINRRARKRFIETFAAVRENFAEIFEVLFEGGEADLHLGEGSDPLEADIIIRARPKGKRIQDISLLSGGERALTALALLFALYKAKPSPFCIFDEVDAPLDDANIQRFARMLRKFSEDTQFIIITHNKRTMEIADQLFGVTMEEKGISRIVSVDLTEIEDLLARRQPATPKKKEPEAAPVSSN